MALCIGSVSQQVMQTSQQNLQMIQTRIQQVQEAPKAKS
jgi:hypothetical protein